MLSYDETVMKILNILIIESEMKVTYLKWLLKYFVSLFQRLYEHNMRLFEWHLYLLWSLTTRICFDLIGF